MLHAIQEGATFYRQNAPYADKWNFPKTDQEGFTDSHVSNGYLFDESKQGPKRVVCNIFFCAKKLSSMNEL